MTLLTMAQAVAEEIGVEMPVAVATGGDKTAGAILRAINREGKILSRHRNTWGGGWSVLEREYSFTTVAGQGEYDLPDDLAALIEGTAWDRSSYWEMRGDLSPQEWQAIKSGLAATPALRRRWRIKRVAGAGSSVNKFNVDPVPGTSGEELVFEYLSNRWVSDSAGSNFRTAFEADDDVSLLDEDLIEMGAIWRFKAARGLEYTVDLAQYEVERDRRLAADGGTRTLATAYRRLRLPPGNVPETGFGGVT